MGRVSDAMSRAGYDSRWAESDGGAFSAIEDETPFVTGEEPESALVSHAMSESAVVLSARPDSPNQVAVADSVPPVRQRLAPPRERSRSESSGDDVRIADIASTLFRYRWLMVAVVALSIGAAIAYNYQAIPLYEAHALVIVEANTDQVVPFHGTSTEDPGRLDYYVTQMEVLRSRALASKTLERLKLLAPDPKFQVDQVSRLLTALGVAPVRSDMGESRVLNVTYRSTDPEMAAKIVNGLAETYVDQNLESRRQGSRDAFESLNQRLAELRRDVTASQGAMQQYRVQKDAVSLGDQGNIVVQKLAQLNQAVTSARMDRLDKQTLYEQLKRIRDSGAPLDTFSPILSSTFVQNLKAELATLQRERGQLSQRLGDQHPDMIRINGSIETAEKRLSAEMAKIVEGIENDYAAAQAREKAMTETLENQKREALELSQKSIGFSALQRDAASSQQMFDTVLQRVKETELSAGLQSNNVKILDRAEVPHTAIWPQKKLNLMIAFGGGVFLAVVLAFGMEYVNPRIARSSDVANALGLPLLGTAPKIPRFRNLAAIGSLPPAFQEAVRTIRTGILLSPLAGTSRALAVTSANAGEGKTALATSLAASMAAAGRRVLLVDSDLRRPQVHQLFKVARTPGLSEVLSGTMSANDAVKETSVPGLFVITAGSAVARPGDALESERLTQLVQELTQVFDLIVMDCPPVVPVADAAIIAHAASAVLFVVGAGKTSRATAQTAIDRLLAVQAQVVGVVLNKARPDAASAYHYAPSLSEHTA
jgi:succinoglycan biosynthesis transport protein ExoP